MKRAGLSAGQYTQAMRLLPMQLTDVVTSLASGMPLWQVAIQQGGQVRDSFGGIGNAARLYKVVDGNRRQIGGKDLKVKSNEWHLLKVVYNGEKVQCFFNNAKVIEATDDTFDHGGVGLWTKADSYTFFDDFVVQESK